MIRTAGDAMNKPPFVFTLCDPDDLRVEELRSSLHGNLHVIEAYAPSMGNLSKIFKVREFLASAAHLQDESIVVFVDAYDVLCIHNNLPSLAEQFRLTGKDLIAGAESIFCHHRSNVLPFFLSRYIDKPARYLNSGFIIAYKWAYLRMLDHIVDNFAELYMDAHHRSDQRVISAFMLDNDALNIIDMEIDSTQQFCHTHTYDDNPMDPTQINSFFVHVTWLALEIQKDAYWRIKDHFLGCSPAETSTHISQHP